MQIPLDDTLTWDNDRCLWTVADTGTHLIEIVPMIFNHRVVLTPKSNIQVYDAGWCYPSFLAALKAVAEWNPQTEPEPPDYVKRAV